jgi:hypothetical protein
MDSSAFIETSDFSRLRKAFEFRLGSYSMRDSDFMLGFSEIFLRLDLEEAKLSWRKLMLLSSLMEF